MKLLFKKEYLKWVVAALLLSILPGQMVRLQSSSSDSGVLVADILVMVLAFAWLLVLIFKKQLPRDTANKLLLVWIAVLFLSWLVAVPSFGTKPVVIAFAYLIRFIAYLSLFSFASRYASLLKKEYLTYMVVTTISLLGFGWLILYYLPNFAPLAVSGWDPHVGRLTSTWLDPNYFGSYLALVFAAAVCFEKELWNNRKKWLLLVLFLGACILGIHFTVSRSALVVLVVAGLVASARTSWRAAALTLVAVLALSLIPGRLQNRVGDSLSYVGGSTTSSTTGGQPSAVDPTANARVESWKKALTLTKKRPVLGVGYNFYEVASVKYGLIQQSGETRGTSGSDSSLLTLLATSGIIGLIAALAFFGFIGYRFWVIKTNWTTAGLSVMAGLFVGSQFNNALLYPLILLPAILLLGIAYSDTKKKK